MNGWRKTGRGWFKAWQRTRALPSPVRHDSALCVTQSTYFQRIRVQRQQIHEEIEILRERFGSKCVPTLRAKMVMGEGWTSTNTVPSR